MISRSSIGIPASLLDLYCGTGIQAKDNIQSENKLEGELSSGEIKPQSIDPNKNIPLSDIGLYKIKYIDPKKRKKN